MEGASKPARKFERPVPMDSFADLCPASEFILILLHQLILRKQ